MSDSRELAAHQPGAMSETGQRLSQTITMVREAMLNPAVDADKAKVMAELLNNQEDRALLSEFNRDLNAAIMDMPVITKAGIITIPARDNKPARTQGRFARFEDIDRVVRPILQRNNLAIRFEVGDLNNMVTVTPILSHANGHTERGGTMRLPLDDSGAKNKVQGTGSSVQYGKRYTMCGLLNIVTEGSDDDGSLGRLSIDMPHERQVTVLEEAEDAAAQGRYADWFGQQGVKDRAWLVNAGHHSRLGGGAALPGHVADDPPARQEQPPERPRRADPPARGDEPDTSTPEGWTAKYELDCRAAASMDDLQRVHARAATGIAKLKAGHPTLHERARKAQAGAVARLSGGGDDLFEGESE